MPTFYVSNFAETDLPILDQLVRDTVFSKVYGETTDSSILKRRKYHITVHRS